MDLAIYVRIHLESAKLNRRLILEANWRMLAMVMVGLTFLY